jgi:hypothetical protein
MKIQIMILILYMKRTIGKMRGLTGIYYGISKYWLPNKNVVLIDNQYGLTRLIDIR